MTNIRLRIREYCRSESLGIVIPVAITILYAVWGLLGAMVNGLVLPIVLNALTDEASFGRGLVFHVAGVRFDWTNLFTDGFTLILLAVVLFWVFVQQLPDDEEDDDDDEETLPCPYCKSDIYVDATRCPFCTSEVAFAVSFAGTDGESS